MNKNEGYTFQVPAAEMLKYVEAAEKISLRGPHMESMLEFFQATFNTTIALAMGAAEEPDPEERAVKLTIAAARIAAFSLHAGLLFTAIGSVSASLSEHADKAGAAAVGVVDALVERKVAQWAKEAETVLS